MVWVAIVEAVALVVAVATFVRAFAGLQRQHARREDLLIAQLLHTTGNAWTPPPIDEWRRDTKPREPEKRTWTPTPEQHPTG